MRISLRFVLFLAMMFCVFLGDGIMSYFAPIIMEDRLGSATRMGLIMATSSVVGSLTDFLFARFFHQKRSFFFQRMLFMLIFLFPLTFLIKLDILYFFLAMAWWGISYEAMIFTTFHTVHESVDRLHHDWAWGLVSMFRNISLVIGPIIASVAHEQSEMLPLFFAILMNCLGVALFLFYLLIKKREHHSLDEQPHASQVQPNRSFWDQIAIWRTLDKAIWPLLVFLLLFHLFDSAVYTVGPLLSEHLKEVHEWGGLLVSVYSVPGIFIGMFVHKLAQPYGKKRLAFICGILAGIAALLMSWSSWISMIILLMFVSALFFSILFPAITAVFEDLMGRSDLIANDIVALTSLMGSIGYVVGPALNGMMADYFGELTVFRLWGGLVLIWSLVLLVFFPRKVKLPQAELNAQIFHPKLRTRHHLKR